jgi:2-oxoisovalerate dehydrogenase E2 component (dihydrolipoyl transacylase)
VKLAGEPGDMVAVGAALVVFETKATAANTTSAAMPRTKNEAAAETPIDVAISKHKNLDAAQDRMRVMTSPAVRRRAKEAGVDLALVSGSGVGGRISRKDLDHYLQAQATGRPMTTHKTAAAGVQEIKVIGLRRIIAERMSKAKQEIPHFSYIEEIDITELEALRKRLNNKNGNAADRLTLLPFLGIALIRALREFPQCNATYDKQRNVLLQYEAVHLGVATQTPDGLKVPVVKHAETCELDELAKEIRRITTAARDNSAKKNELSGSTITITSLGKLGGIASTPVINLPEVGIIGVNRAVERPMVFNGQIAVRLMMNLSSSFDHRFVDGYDAAALIQRIKEMLEHPATLFLD